MLSARRASRVAQNRRETRRTHRACASVKVLLLISCNGDLRVNFKFNIEYKVVIVSRRNNYQ